MSDLASLHRSGLLPRIAELAYVPDPTRVALDVPTSQPWSQLMVVVDDLHYDLDQADDLAPFSWLRLGSFVKVAGEWHQVIGIDRCRQQIQVREDASKPAWWYQATEGERFAVEEPF